MHRYHLPCVFMTATDKGGGTDAPGRLSENGYFSQSPRQAEIIILEILHCIPVVIIPAFLDLEKNISFSDSLLAVRSVNAIDNETCVR